MRVGINGFGRIGRTLGRLLSNHPDIHWVAVNDLMDEQNMKHLFRYDSVHGVYQGEIKDLNSGIQFGNSKVQVSHEKNPEEIPWSKAEVDVVIECTGIFRDEDQAKRHVHGTVQKVLLSAPAKKGNVPTVVMGINDDILQGDEVVLSNASCTTNCAAPMVDLIDEFLGIEKAYITTVHSYTGDQRLHDSPHKDLRRARAGAMSIVPTTTGAAKAITKIFPHLEGHLGGCGIRVPVPDGSLTDITFMVKKEAEAEEINDYFRAASAGKLKGVLGITEDPIVSVDIQGNPASCIFDTELTSVLGKMVKIVGWYDNEAGYSNRLVDLLLKIKVQSFSNS